MSGQYLYFNQAQALVNPMSSSQESNNTAFPPGAVTQTTEKRTSEQPHSIDRMELLAEKADIHIEKQATGRLLLRKVVREQTVQIPVVLTEEVLVIEYQENTVHNDSTLYPGHTASILLNGETLTLNHNQSIEVPVYREEAVIHKKVVITEQVDIGKITRQRTVTHSVELRHEELDIEEQHNQPANVEPSDPKN